MTFAMRILGGKWKNSILCALKLNGPRRYNTLMRKIKNWHVFLVTCQFLFFLSISLFLINEC
jgi:DNA-binding HxlR family transcriptional regulator